MITITNPVFETLDDGSVSCTDSDTGERGYGDDAREAYRQCLRVKYSNRDKGIA